MPSFDVLVTHKPYDLYGYYFEATTRKGVKALRGRLAVEHYPDAYSLVAELKGAGLEVREKRRHGQLLSTLAELEG